MSTQLLQTMQQLIDQSLGAANLSDYVIGVVETVSPVSIRIEQKDIVTEDFLTFTDLVKDYDVDIGVMHTTENKSGGSGQAEYESHNHEYKGRKKIHVYNGLKVGESVIMLRQAGGQEFCVLSRVFNHAGLSGQWG